MAEFDPVKRRWLAFVLFAGLVTALAARRELADRGHDAGPLIAAAAVLLVFAAIAAALSRRTFLVVSAPTVIVGLLASGLVANAFAGITATRQLDCLLGAAKAPAAKETAIVAISAPRVVAHPPAAAGADVILLVTQRHKGANGEGKVETARFEATVDTPGDAPLVRVVRGDKDAELSSLVTALADAEAVVILPAPAGAESPAGDRKPTCAFGIRLP